MPASVTTSTQPCVPPGWLSCLPASATGSVLFFSRPRSNDWPCTPWTCFLHLSVLSVILTDSARGSEAVLTDSARGSEAVLTDSARGSEAVLTDSARGSEAVLNTVSKS